MICFFFLSALIVHDLQPFGSTQVRQLAQSAAVYFTMNEKPVERPTGYESCLEFLILCSKCCVITEVTARYQTSFFLWCWFFLHTEPLIHVSMLNNLLITGAQARYDISNNASINTSGYELCIRESLRHILNSNLIFCLGLCLENKACTTKALDTRCPILDARYSMSARSSLDPRQLSHAWYALEEGNLPLGGTVCSTI